MTHTMNQTQFQRWQELDGHIQRFYRDSTVPTPTPEEWAEYEALRKLTLPPQKPDAGTPVTYSIGTDKYAGVVFLVVTSGREIWADFPRLGMRHFTYRPTDGSYREKGLPCGRLTIGIAEDYSDPGF